jgi:hypothetical protein
MNDQTHKEIDKCVSKVLKDGGIKKPPVRIEDILDCLELNRDFYDLDDPCMSSAPSGQIFLTLFYRLACQPLIHLSDYKNIHQDRKLPAGYSVAAPCRDSERLMRFCGCTRMTPACGPSMSATRKKAMDTTSGKMGNRMRSAFMSRTP